MYEHDCIKKSITESSDSMKDLAVFLGKLTDHEGATLDQVEKAAHAFRNTAEGLCYAVKSLEGMEHHMEDHASHTGYDRAYHMVKPMLAAVPAEWTPHVAAKGGLDAIIKMEEGKLDKALASGNYQERIHAYKCLAASVLYAIEHMTCDK